VSGFDAWLCAIPAAPPRAEADAALRGHIGRVFAARRRVYGAPRVHAEPRREGPRHARRRGARLMRDMGPSARRGRKRPPRTTDSRHDRPVAPNLLDRNFAADRPDQVWLADVSSIPTDEGWLCLAAVKDLATREVLGWSMADHLRAALCVGALVMAIRRHGPPPRGLIQHSDRGVQYASEPYRAVLARHGLVQSMSRRGNCLDNAPREGFFASLKTEHVHLVRFRSRAEKAAVFEYREVFDNRARLHSGLGHRTPAEARASMEGIAMRAAA
jgi:transposase InsO family protein